MSRMLQDEKNRKKNRPYKQLLRKQYRIDAKLMYVLEEYFCGIFWKG